MLGLIVTAIVLITPSKSEKSFSRIRNFVQKSVLSKPATAMIISVIAGYISKTFEVVFLKH